MKENDLLQMRCENQQLARQSAGNVTELVSWLGAVQAQDYSMSKWAIGMRVKDVTVEKVEKAIHEAEIVRTHVLRPTWHWVAASDIRWMLALSAPRIRRQMEYYDRRLGIDQKEKLKSNTLFEKILAKQEKMNRRDLQDLFTAAKVNTGNMRFGHLLMYAELDAIICNGPSEGNEITYALFDKRIKPGKKIPREEALVKLAQKYFQSHGPATIRDFAWWSGLSVADVRQAMAVFEKDLNEVVCNGISYYFFENDILLQKKNTVYLLPNYDEYTVAYRDRSLLMSKDISANLSRNGNPLFSNTIMQQGKIKGTWSRTIKKDNMIVKMDFLEPPSAIIQKQIRLAEDRFRKFWL